MEINKNLSEKSTEIANLIDQNKILEAQITLYREITKALTSDLEQKDTEKTDLDNKLNCLNVKYQTMVSCNSKIIANLENKK